MAQERLPGDPVFEPYQHPAEAVGAEMARVALLLRQALPRLTRGSAAADLSGPAQAERELLRLEVPANRAPLPAPAGDSDGTGEPDEVDEIERRLRQRERRNAGCRAATPTPLPLYQLAERAQLSPLAFDLFLLALAPEIDEGFGRVLQLLRGRGDRYDRHDRRALDLATAARVLTPREVGAGALRLLLGPGGALCDLGLLELLSPAGEGVTLGTGLLVPPPVVAFVLGQAPHDPALRLFARPAAQVERRRAFLPDALFAHAAAVLEDPGSLLCLEGPAGVGKSALLQVLCAARGRALLRVDVGQAPEGFSRAEAQAVVRLGFLLDAALLLHVPPAQALDTPPPWQAGVALVLSRYGGRGVALARQTPLAHGVSDAEHRDLPVPPALRLAPLAVPPPDPATRQALWRDRLHDADGVDLEALARNYPITAGVITRVAEEARVLSRARGAPLAQRDVQQAIEAEFAPQLHSVGRRLRLPRETRLDELVLSAEARETLAEFLATVRLRHRVLDEWGFGQLTRGRGVSALFYGDPGTGKTLAAGVIAAACGLPLYQIDTAQVVSKWVGETEKNLGAVFRAAEAGHAMLLFDEADAIFGKRTDVQHSTDRFANMQTNFLLSQIEAFGGVVVLTTNKESVMDPAFQRRLSFRVHFPMPEEREREALWRQMLGGQRAHLADKIHVAELARRLPMSGGYIRNAVLRAAYLAAAQEQPITTALLRQAAELVLRDAGKVI